MTREGIILAGGFGTRLRHLVPDVPKPMAPIAGRPFLEILLEDLAKKGFGRIVLSVGFMAEKIMSHFGQRFAGIDLTYAVEQSPLGTGGGLRFAMTKCDQDHVLVFNGDTFLDLEIERVERQWQRRGLPIIVGRELVDTTRYGRLSIEGHQVIGLAKDCAKGPGMVNAGCYVFNKGQLNSFPINLAFSLEVDYLATVLPRMPFDLFITSGYFIDIGVDEDYVRAQKELSRR